MKFQKQTLNYSRVGNGMQTGMYSVIIVLTFHLLSLCNVSTYNIKDSLNISAVGFTNGSVRIVDGLSLKDVCSSPFRYARDAITHVVFSHDSHYLATAVSISYYCHNIIYLNHCNRIACFKRCADLWV